MKNLIIALFILLIALMIAYALNGNKYEILGDNSERVHVKNKQTNKISQTYYFSGGSKHGAYIDINKDLREIIYNNKSILELSFKIKPKANYEQDSKTDKLIVNISPYKNKTNEINISNECIQMSTDINDNSRKLIYDLSIAYDDSRKPLNK